MSIAQNGIALGHYAPRAVAIGAFSQVKCKISTPACSREAATILFSGEPHFWEVTMHP